MKTAQKLGLNGNRLKLIALFAMTLDHIGFVLLPDFLLLRIIGRISFPLFAMMIAEGCRYTRNMVKYFLTIFLLGAVCQIPVYVVNDSLYMGVLITFSLSIPIVFAWQNMTEGKPTFSKIALFVLSVGLSFFVCCCMPVLLSGTDFHVDYTFFGTLLPLAARISDDKRIRLPLMTAAMCGSALGMFDLQWFSLLALPLIFLYNGERGSARLKHLFYVYYPLHLAVI